jgi:hypothetical protein
MILLSLAVAACLTAGKSNEGVMLTEKLRAKSGSPAT